MLPKIPFLSGDQPLARAHLEIEVPKVSEPKIELRFNPTEYRLEKSNEFQEIAIPGLEAPPIQFVRGGTERLTVDVLLDTTHTQEDVQKKYVARLWDLMKIKSELHAPAIVRFVWDRAIFRGVLTNLTVNYELFAEGGVPLRAKATLAMTAYRPVEVQVREIKAASPDTEKSVVLRRGDRLDGLAESIFRDPSRWRDIARANDIRDPRDLKPGRLLLVPRIPQRSGS
jgi:Contractile injection system tube protein